MAGQLDVIVEAVLATGLSWSCWSRLCQRSCRHSGSDEHIPALQTQPWGPDGCEVSWVLSRVPAEPWEVS